MEKEPKTKKTKMKKGTIEAEIQIKDVDVIFLDKRLAEDLDKEDVGSYIIHDHEHKKARGIFTIEKVGKTMFGDKIKVNLKSSANKRILRLKRTDHVYVLGHRATAKIII